MKVKNNNPFRMSLTMSGETATIELSGVIGWDMSATEFCNKVDEAKAAGASELVVKINSVGGYCYDGLAMGDALKNCGMKTRGVVCGTAQSMASYLLQMCDVREANRTATIMFHQPSAGVRGTVDEIMVQAKYLCSMRDRMFEAMGARCGKSGADLSAECQTMQMYNAEDAKAKGFLDVVTGEPSEKPDNAGAEMKLPEGVKMYGECNGVFDVAMYAEQDDEPDEKPEDTPAPEEKPEEKPEPESKPEEKPEEKPTDAGNVTMSKAELDKLIADSVATAVNTAVGKAEAGIVARLSVPLNSAPGTVGGEPKPAKMSAEEIDNLPWYKRPAAQAANGTM